MRKSAVLLAVSSIEPSESQQTSSVCSFLGQVVCPKAITVIRDLSPCNGVTPNAFQYTQTIPYFVYTESTCRSACTQNHPCEVYNTRQTHVKEERQ
ncbi:hypothetical protein V8E54_011739 [Elaphomyces granulatus]